MHRKSLSLIKPILILSSVLLLVSCGPDPKPPVLDHEKLANDYYQEDAQWYIDNIPFFECSDKQIEQVYYYRWKLYKAHIRNVTDNGYVITEFIDHVGWDREPFCTINAASMHHIYEGRWLKDPRYMDGYISNLYHGGNNRSYSESIADASYARYLVDGDPAFITAQLDSMKSIYDQWSDHWDASKSLYYIPAMPDATEYTIASIDASGGTGGFEGGDAFRPTLNSYMYGNAMAISNIAAIKGDEATREEYLNRAMSLKSNIEKDLWNESLEHFTDRFKVDNKYVHYWDFIRGRELAGLIPWYFNLPEDNAKFNAAWKHATDTSQLLGQFGFRTNEPSYQYYFKQFIFFQGQRGSQWNGPSWPYQSSQAITAMANVLNNYDQDVVKVSDYLKSLRQFTLQHYLPNGKINLVENYDPNLGGPIVYYYWSNHYLHSSYNNLVISGLCGIRPSDGDTLDINPLVDGSVKYFFLDDVIYHGHKLSLIYDEDGSKYNSGKGLTVLVDGKKVELIRNGNRYKAVIGPKVVTSPAPQPVNIALNIARKDFPVPSASVNSVADSIYQAIDGKIWYFPEIRNRWTTLGSTSTTDWYAIDFGKPREASIIKVYLFADHQKFEVPDSIVIEYLKDGQWLAVKTTDPKGVKLTGNTGNVISFEKIATNQIRIILKHEAKHVAISELEYY